MDNSKLRHEEWRAVDGYEGRYEVSDQGRVRSLPRTYTDAMGVVRSVRGRIMRTGLSGGYPGVTLSKNCIQTRHRVHVLAAWAFLGSPGGTTGVGAHDYQVNHKDGNKANNAAANLEWVTHSENVSHAARNGLMPRGGRANGAKLNEEQVRAIRERYAQGGISHLRLGKEYGVKPATIGSIITRENWSHLL